MELLQVDVRRVIPQPRETDRIVRPILAAMPEDERRSYVRGLLDDCEREIEELGAQILAEEAAEKRAAVEYWARRQIFEDPAVDELAAAIRNAQAQIAAYHDEISDLSSLVLLCRKELEGQEARYSLN